MSEFRPEPFGKYYLVDKIATGGMAEIFKAKTYSHGGFENLMVIKRILSHLGENEDFVEMFIDEAKVSVALQHANITRIYDFGKIVNNYFIAMECVDGKDVRNLLRKLARRREYLPIEFAAYIAHQACRGLEYAHSKQDVNGKPYGIVHRDMSPANILVSYEGDIKIADFGIAKAELNSGTTDAGTLKGKFEYMSPEQARGEDIDGRSDLFSLGIVLHEMLTGRRLFKGDGDAASLEKIKSGKIPSPSQVNQRVPPALDEIVMRALDRDREQRYATAQDMQEALEAYIPETVDVSRSNLTRFMQSIFEQEIIDERSRLKQGSLAAESFRDQFPAEEWDGTTATTFRTDEPKKNWAPLAIIGILAVLASILSSVAIVLWMEPTPPPVAPTTPVVQEVAPSTTGTLDVTLFPGGNIFINGAQKGMGESLTLEEMEAGSYEVTVRAEGYKPFTETVTVSAEKTTKVIHRFIAIRNAQPPKAKEAPIVAPKEVSPPKKEVPVATAPGTLSIGIIGGGWATIYVDGTKLDKTAPLAAHSLPVGTYTVRAVNPDLGLDSSQKVTIRSGEKTRLNLRP